MRKKVKEKQDAYAALVGSTTDEEKETNKARYNTAKKMAE